MAAAASSGIATLAAVQTAPAATPTTTQRVWLRSAPRMRRQPAFRALELVVHVPFPSGAPRGGSEVGRRLAGYQCDSRT